MSLFISKPHDTINNEMEIKKIIDEIIRVLQLIQYILYLAPSEIKNKFVMNNLGELIIKVYSSTLNNNKLIHNLHDMLLSVCVNFIAHSQNAKCIMCFGNNSKNNKNKNKKKRNDFLINILTEAFNSKTRLNSYLLCFDILDSMMLNIVKIKKDKLKHRRICCIRLLRNTFESYQLQVFASNIIAIAFGDVNESWPSDKKNPFTAIPKKQRLKITFVFRMYFVKIVKI